MPCASRALPLAVLLAFASVTPAAAEVTHSSSTGFATRDSVVVAASPAEVWAALIQPERWWNGQHSWGGDAAAFRLDPRAGGCFCEDLGGEGSVEHMRVVLVRPAALLRMRGALGPLQGEGLDGALTIELTATDGGGTTIAWTYVVGGFARYDLAAIAEPVDAVQSEQLRRLAALLSTGDANAGIP